MKVMSFIFDIPIAAIALVFFVVYARPLARAGVFALLFVGFGLGSVGSVAYAGETVSFALPDVWPSDFRGWLELLGFGSVLISPCPASSASRSL